jgi:cephalosporin hydroxylase
MQNIDLISVDFQKGEVSIQNGGGIEVHPFSSAKAFGALSQAWLRCGWDTKYVYSFTWLGRPIIQLPEDMFRIQEVIFGIQPDVIIETGVAHGGSLIFYASLCKAIGKGRVIGIDIEIRPHNRKAIEAHTLYEYITLLEGSSTSPEVLAQVRKMVAPGETTLVLLDSNHTKQHVLEELRAYSPLVPVNSYIVACDGIMADLAGAPRTEPDWLQNNPLTAIQQFLGENRDFIVEEPAFPFNEGSVQERVTYWPSGFLKRVKAAAG